MESMYWSEFPTICFSLFLGLKIYLLHSCSPCTLSTLARINSFQSVLPAVLLSSWKDFFFPTNLCPKPEEIVLIPSVGVWHFSNDCSFSRSALKSRRVYIYFLFSIQMRISWNRRQKGWILCTFALATPCVEFFTQMAKMQPEDNDPPARAHRYLTWL